MKNYLEQFYSNEQRQVLDNLSKKYPTADKAMGKN